MFASLSKIKDVLLKSPAMQKKKSSNISTPVKPMKEEQGESSPMTLGYQLSKFKK